MQLLHTPVAGSTVSGIAVYRSALTLDWLADEDSKNCLFQCYADYHLPYNISHSTVSGIAAYRSALTLDFFADQDSRQRELAHVFENEGPLYKETDQSKCITSSRPSGVKVARLMLELLKNLEGDDGVIQELIHTLTRTEILVELLQLDVEPNLESLVQTSRLMQGEPHATLPRVLAVVWLLASDPVTTQSSGWCSIKKFTQFLATTPPAEIAAHMRTGDPMLARARFVIEEFMQTVAPFNVKRHVSDTFKPEFRGFENRIALPTLNQRRRCAATENSTLEDGTSVTRLFLPTAHRPVSLSNVENAACTDGISYICLVVILYCDLTINL